MNSNGEPINNPLLDGGVINGDLEVDGTLTMTDFIAENGIVTDTLTVNTLISDISTEDAIIELAKNNPADNFNIGFTEEWNDGSVKHSAFLRSKDNKGHYIIEGVSTMPTPTEDIRGLPRGNLFVNSFECNTTLLGANGSPVQIGTSPYTMPSVDGTNGQAISTNGSGILFFQTIDMQAAYNKSSSPQITTTVDNPELSIQTHINSFTNKVFNVKDTAGNEIFDVISPSTNFGFARAQTGLVVGDTTGIPGLAMKTDAGLPCTVNINTTDSQDKRISFQEADVPVFEISTDASDSDNLKFIASSGTEILTVKQTGVLTVNESYSLPAADGTIGQVLKTDGAGTLTFQDISPVNGRALATGVFDGGVLSVNGGDNTKYDITDGTGEIVDPVTGIVTEVSWTGLTAQSTTYSGILTFVSINSSGLPVYSVTEPTNSQIRDNIFLGVLVHVNGVNIDVVNNQQMTILNGTNQIKDLANAVGFINTNGNTCGPSGANLTFVKSAGAMFAFGSNYFNDIKNPHEITTPLVDTNAGGIFQYRYQDGSSGPLTDTLLIPSEYDDGNGQGSPGTVTSNDWQIQRVYLFTSNNVKIQPGQDTYNTKTEALNGIQTEPFVTEPSILANGLLIGYIVVRGGASNLNLSGDAQFLQASKFGTGGGGSGGSGGGVLGPVSSTDNAIVRWDGASGTLLKDSGVTISATGVIDGSPSVWDVSKGGGDNYVVGTGSGDSLAVGATRNIFAGSSVGTEVSVADNITAIGYQAMQFGNGIDHTAIGSGALRGVAATSSGDSHTAVGFEALVDVTTGSDSTAVGWQAGKNLTSGSQCTSLGADTFHAPTLNNQTAIGQGATTTQANSVVLGNASVTLIRPMSNGLCDLGEASFPLKDIHTGRVLAPNGTAGTPRYTFSGHPTTGMYHTGLDSIGLSANGTRIVEVSPNEVILKNEASLQLNETAAYVENPVILKMIADDIFDAGLFMKVQLNGTGTSALGRVVPITIFDLDSVPIIGVSLDSSGISGSTIRVAIGGTFWVSVQTGATILAGDLIEKSGVDTGRAVTAVASTGSVAVALTGGLGVANGSVKVLALWKRSESF